MSERPDKTWVHDPVYNRCEVAIPILNTNPPPPAPVSLNKEREIQGLIWRSERNSTIYTHIRQELSGPSPGALGLAHYKTLTPGPESSQQHSLLWRLESLNLRVTCIIYLGFVAGRDDSDLLSPPEVVRSRAERPRLACPREHKSQMPSPCHYRLCRKPDP